MKLQIDSRLPSLINQTHLPSELGFGQFFSPLMVRGEYSQGNWQSLNLLPYAPLSLDPAAMIFHYGQSIFEGLKAYRTPDGLQLFRPWDHAHRFNISAERMAMPSFPEELFVESAIQFCRLSAPLLPEGDQYTLYLRPFMIATQVGLGVKPSHSYSFLLIGSPSEKYFSVSGGVKVMIERQFHRAVAHGGTGSVKTGGNYSASLLSDRKIKELGFHQSLWLDSETSKHIEEMTGMNFFAVVRGQLITPALNGSILPGITRDSILYLAKELGVSCMETAIDIDQLVEQIKSGDCSECFLSGTAAGITSVRLLGEKGGTVYPLPETDGPITLLLRKNLADIQRGRRSVPSQWNVKVNAKAEK